MISRILILGFVFVAVLQSIWVSDATAQLVAIDTTKPIIAPEITITATRTPRNLERVPVPVSVIGAEDIQMQAVTTVSDLLQSQVGMNLEYSRFGAAGVQLQGLDAAYTLVLLDGEPLATNVDGFADVSRIPAASIERVEITYGPSSSLYGSEALAGVVNIITKRSARPFSSSAQIQYGSNNSLDLNADVQTSGSKGSAGLFLNRFSSDGYDLYPQLPGQTVSPYETYNVTGRGDYKLSKSTVVKGTGVVGTQHVDAVSALQRGSVEEGGNQYLNRFDWNVAPSIVHSNASFGRLTLSSQAARSVVDANHEDDAQPELQDFLDFKQFRSETEAQYDRLVGMHFHTSVGTGVTYESVEAEFIEGNTRSTTSGYGFGQVEWIPSSDLDVIGSARIDIHPDYTTQLNPKLAASWTGIDKFRLQASVGRGFRAPTYEQRYINFTNPLGGSYTVLGAEGLGESLALLDASGLVSEYLIDPTDTPPLSPESSWSYMAGVDFDASSNVSLRAMAFYNNVRNLIETQVVAIASSGTNIFSYVNLGKVFTRGVQLDGTLGVTKNMSVGLAYQFLDARSEDLDAELGGRSKHSGVIKLQGNVPAIGLEAYIQSVMRSSYPFITGAALQVDPSVLLDVVATKEIGSGFALTAGIRNLLDHTAPAFEPEQPGRVFFIQTSFRY